MSPAMKQLLDDATDAFDWVVVDTPPIAILPDANLLAAMIDTALLVVSAQSTPYPMVQRAAEAIGTTPDSRRRAQSRRAAGRLPRRLRLLRRRALPATVRRRKPRRARWFGVASRGRQRAAPCSVGRGDRSCWSPAKRCCSLARSSSAAS